MRIALTLFVSALAGSAALAAEHVPLTGKVIDRSGKPLERATVLIYHARVKRGYSTFCPSCYVDCGKRAITASDGTFSFKNVHSDLLFELMAVRDGFQPAFVKKVDPLNQSVPTAVLLPRATPGSAGSVAYGRVVDDHGLPLRDAVIEPRGISMNEYPDGSPSKGPVSIYGPVRGLEPVAVTDAKRDFELASEKHALAMLLGIEARGFAPKFESLPTGSSRQTVTMSLGAVVRGRLTNKGRPVAEAEIGLFPRRHGEQADNLTIIGDPYGEIRVGTQGDGSFVLADVPAPVDWYLYAKMESVSTRGAMQPVECSTRRGGEIVNVGDIQLQPGYRLRGRVTLSDGAYIADGMRIMVLADRALDSQTAVLQPDGSFEFSGLPAGGYRISPAVRGYYLAEQNRQVSIDRDVDGFTVVLKPGSHP